MSRPLRVMLLSHLASRRAPTGAECSLAGLAKGLAGRGHRVAVVAPGPWVLADELEQAGVDVEIVPSRGCWLTYWEPRPWPVVAAKWLRHAWPSLAVWRLVRLITDWQPDVVHVNCLPHLRGAAAARRSGRPFVWHLREILPPGPRHRIFAHRLATSGAHLVAVSRAVAAWLAEERLEALVVHNGIEVPDLRPEPVPARTALGLPAEGTWLGYAGQLLPHKGVLAVVHAAARACREVPELRVVIAGSGPDRFVR
ncbi:MAG TPA: glycosyltransferase, partial [Thermoanaerobaculaceae bacterium]|nr:glycosyltransferase [Thermoanaerobaculaceae bacterium]